MWFPAASLSGLIIVGCAGIGEASGNSLSVCYAHSARVVSRKWKSRGPVTYGWYEHARWQNYMGNGGEARLKNSNVEASLWKYCPTIRYVQWKAKDSVLTSI